MGLHEMLPPSALPLPACPCRSPAQPSKMGPKKELKILSNRNNTEKADFSPLHPTGWVAPPAQGTGVKSSPHQLRRQRYF